MLIRTLSGGRRHPCGQALGTSESHGMSQQPQYANRLLAALPEADYKRLLPYLTTVSLRQREPLWSPRAPIQAAYFPCTAMASISAFVEHGEPVEVAAVGNEGVVGLP